MKEEFKRIYIFETFRYIIWLFKAILFINIERIEIRMRESLKDKIESAISEGFEKAQEEKVSELNRLSQTGKQISRKDYNSRSLSELYKELGLEYPTGKPVIMA